MSAQPDPIRFTIPPLLCTPYRRVNGQRVPDIRKPKLRKLVGYYTRGSRPDAIRLSEYLTWKAHVLQHAPRNLPRPSKGQPVQFNVVCYFADGIHADPENVRKGVVDALYGRSNGGDKFVYGTHASPHYDAVNPRVEITIRQAKYEQS